MATYEPAYVALQNRGQLAQRAKQAVAALADCQLCGRRCHANRLSAGSKPYCDTRRWACMGNAFPYFGDAACLRGRHGSGTIFFSHCNLRCAICASADLSRRGEGRLVSAEELAAIMLRLQEQGCQHLHLVTPSHVVAQILEALVLAVERGLCLPIIYNTGGYDSLEALRLLDGVVDIYLPDFKFWDTQVSRRIAEAADYAEVACQAIQEMYRQVGNLVLDDSGLARRGLLVRHLLLPGGLAGTDQVLRFLAQEISLDTWVHLTSQYCPDGVASHEALLRRRVSLDQYYQALALASQEGLRHLVHA